jgi:hypothetical protein
LLRNGTADAGKCREGEGAVKVNKDLPSPDLPENIWACYVSVSNVPENCGFATCDPEIAVITLTARLEGTHISRKIIKLSVVDKETVCPRCNYPSSVGIRYS